MVLNLYANPNDLNIFVRKKGRHSAWTLNFGNIWAWLLIAAVSLIVTGALGLSSAI